MRKLIAAGMLAGAALVSAGVAHADSDQTLGDHDGAALAKEIKQSDNAEIDQDSARNLGAKVCRERASGWTEKDVFTDLHFDFGFALASDLLVEAEWHFCPTYLQDYEEIRAEEG